MLHGAEGRGVAGLVFDVHAPIGVSHPRREQGDAASPWLSAEAGAEADTLRLIAALARCMDAGKAADGGGQTAAYSTAAGEGKAIGGAAADGEGASQPCSTATIGTGGGGGGAQPGTAAATADAVAGAEAASAAGAQQRLLLSPMSQLVSAALAALAAVFEDKPGKPPFVLSASRTSALCEIAGRLVASILRPGVVLAAEAMRPGSLDVLAGAMSAAPSWVARRSVDGCSFVGELGLLQKRTVPVQWFVQSQKHGGGGHAARQPGRAGRRDVGDTQLGRAAHRRRLHLRR